MTWRFLHITLWKRFCKAWAWLLIEMPVKLLPEISNLPCTLSYFYTTFSRGKKTYTFCKSFCRMGKENTIEILSPYFVILTCQIPPCWISWQMKKHVHSWKPQHSQGWRVFSWKMNTNLKWTPGRVHVVAAEEESETAMGRQTLVTWAEAFLS